MDCTACGFTNPDATAFCGGCGRPLEQRCPRCDTANPPTHKFCGGCGTPIAGPPRVPIAPDTYTPRHLAEKILTARRALAGERKQITALFCDVVNSTMLAEQRGAEAMHTLLNRFFALVLDEVHRYEGSVNAFLGDGFLALFGVPLAHEDHARRAALAALGIQRRLAERVAELGRQDDGTPVLQVRIGLNSGMVVVAGVGDDLAMEYTAIGDTLNVAARLQALAEPGTVLAGETTARLVEGYVRVAPMGSLQLRGRQASVAGFRLLGVGPRRSPLDRPAGRSLAPFLGREQELAALHDLMDQVMAGRGRVVDLVAEPGMGKSRLLFEFRQSLAGARVTYLEGRCLSYGRSVPYLSVLDLLRANCGIAEDDDADAISTKVRFALHEVELDPDEWAPYLLHLFGIADPASTAAALTPEALKARTFATLRQMCLLGSSRRPLILAVEDLHWIDRTSEEFLATLAEHIADAPILLLGTYRPEYQPPRREQSGTVPITLQPLTPAESLRLVQAMVDGEQLDDGLIELILEKAEGNPFFLEELARAVAAGGGSAGAVPDTIQDVLMARIDRLADEPRRLLQTASVLGREFPLALLSAVWPRPETMGAHLQELKREGFVYEHDAATDPGYIFTHALTRDVAYDSLLASRRRELHAAAGQALERLYAGRLTDAYDRLAYHYARTDQAAKAVEFLTDFAAHAAQRFAHADAVTALHEALPHAERLATDDGGARLLHCVVQLVQSHYSLGRWPEALTALTAQQQRIEGLGDAFPSGPFYLWLAILQNHAGDREAADDNARQAIAAAERHGDAVTLGKAYYAMSVQGLWGGNHRDAVEHGRRAVAVLETTADVWWLAQALWYLGANALFLGEFEPALEALGRARALGRMAGDRRIEALAGGIGAHVRAYRADGQAAIDEAKAALALAPEPVSSAVTRVIVGTAYLENGNPSEAIPWLTQATDELRRMHVAFLEGYHTAQLAAALHGSDRLDEAREVAGRALDVSRTATFWSGVGWAQRVFGAIARSEGLLSEATRQFTEALETFATHHLRFEEARTHLELADLCRERGDDARASAHLTAARSLFVALNVPQWAARADRLAGV